MLNSLLTSNFLITLIKAMKKIKQRFKMSGTDIESIIPSCNGAAVLSAIPWHVSTWKKEVSCCTWKHDSISVPSQNEPGNLQFLAFEGYWYGRMGPKIRNLTSTRSPTFFSDFFLMYFRPEVILKYLPL